MNRRAKSSQLGVRRVISVAITIGCALTIASAATAQPSAPSSTYKFSFAKKPRSGFVSVDPATAYNTEKQFGFIGETPKASSQGVCSDHRAFFFAVDVAEGNSDVTVELGDQNSSTSTTLKAEARRLILEDLRTKPGHFESRKFTVNVRYKELQSGETVRLKPDEQGDFDWDHRLTLEFNGTHPCVRSIEIQPSPQAVTVYIAGDSTVTDQRREPWAAWGQMLPRFFRAGIAIANHAESGESLKSFVGEKRWPKLLDTLKSGDFVLIQFAHNDQKPGSAHVDAMSSYKEYLQRFIDDVRSRNATPVLVTSMHRRRFDEAGAIVNTLEDYPEAMRQLAAADQVPLIDLNAMSKVLFEALGPEGTLKAFVHYPAGSFPGQDKPLADDTHFNNFGAYELARCVVEGIKQQRLSIAGWLNDDRTFDPSHPDSVAAWTLAASPQVTAAKPEGN